MSFNLKASRLAFDLAEAAYLEDWPAACRTLGVEFVDGFDRGGTQAFLCNADGVLFLNIRGTEEILDWFYDMRFIKVEFRRPEGRFGRVHEGFLDAFDQVDGLIDRRLRLIEARLAGRPPLITDGHSLGGGVARVSKVAYGADAAYVWGSPNVGNPDFAVASGGKKAAVYRFVNAWDPVTWVPFKAKWAPVQAAAALIDGRMPTGFGVEGTEIDLGKFGGCGHLCRRYRESYGAYYRAASAGHIALPD